MEEYINEFIRIAKEYGKTITNVVDASKKWKRQYEENQ